MAIPDFLLNNFKDDIEFINCSNNKGENYINFLHLGKMNFCNL